MILRRLLATAALAPLPVHTVEQDEILPDPTPEAHARAISGGLSCLVYQNQSIDDSQASLARGLRVLVRERLQAGGSEQEICHALVLLRRKTR